MLPPSIGDLIFSATVVWVPNCQELHWVPDALGVCRNQMARGLETLALCKIPKDHHSYWPYPTTDEGHLIVMANIPDSHGTLSDFQACKVIEVMPNGEPCIAFNQTTIGDETLRPDLVTLWPIQPRSSLWCNDVFRVLDNDDGSAPALNSVYFMGTKPKEQVPWPLFCTTRPWWQLMKLGHLGAPQIQTLHSYPMKESLGWMPRHNRNQWMSAVGMDTRLTLGHQSIQCIPPIQFWGHKCRWRTPPKPCPVLPHL